MEKRCLIYVLTFESYTESIEDDLKDIRKFLENKWETKKSNRQCIRTVYFLKNVIGGKIVGGWVSSKPRENERGGFLDKTGKWNFHYWIEKNGKIIDITSDQFGEPKINVLPAKDARYVKNCTAQDMKNDFKFTGEVVDAWIEEYKKINKG